MLGTIYKIPNTSLVQPYTVVCMLELMLQIYLSLLLQSRAANI